MRGLRRFVPFFFLACGVFAQPAAQITVSGDIPQVLTLTAGDLAKMPRSMLAYKNERGEELQYAGVLLYDVLKRAGAPLDKQLSGKGMASYVLAEASDGYQVVFSLAEIDPAFTDNRVLLADTLDGKPLPERQGPFRLVVPQDKKGARSIRMLTRLNVVKLRQ
ncbi:MAG TPA: molybdopterin-dependent oxidoreductase [Bryobacteraceae bacterium]|nr:molybdopterin-dependent oxidoreductase [Bryobacteraceae bacterium]